MFVFLLFNDVQYLGALFNYASYNTPNNAVLLMNIAGVVSFSGPGGVH